MADDRVPFEVKKDDLTNHHQLKDAIETVTHGLIHRGCGGMMIFLTYACNTFSYYPHGVDRRSRQMKKLALARAKLIDAANAFDIARAEAKEIERGQS